MTEHTTIPTFDTIMPVTFRDTAEYDDFPDQTGRFTIRDGTRALDSGRFSVSINDNPAVIDLQLIDGAIFTHRADGAYGKLYYNTYTGDYKYVPNDEAINGLAAGVNRADTFKVTATHYQTSLTSQTFTINVMGADDKPVFNDVPDDLTIEENMDGSETAIDIGSAVTARDPEDPENAPVTYVLFKAPDGFTIDPTTGQIRYTGAAFDYEALTPEQRSISLTIFATDSTLVGIQTVTITVTDGDDISVTGGDNVRLIEDSRRLNTAEGQIEVQKVTSTTYSLSVQAGSSTATLIAADDTSITGIYGTLKVDQDGTWEYTVDNDDPDTNGLNSGQTGTETFTFTYTGGGQTLTHTLTVNIEGRTDVTDERDFYQNPPTEDLAIYISHDGIIYTGSGDDIIISTSSYSSSIYARNGNDEVYASRNGSSIRGQGGNDYLYGDDGNDSLYGGTGNDYLYGGDGNDFLSGDGGNDYLYGGAGDDSLSGGDNNDYLSGGLGRDRLSGGTGNDKFVLALTNTRTSDLDIVGGFARGDKIEVDTTSGTETTLDALKSAANIRWTQDSHYHTRPLYNYILDTVIYHTQGTDDTSDDIVLMVLEDYNTALSITDFDII